MLLVFRRTGNRRYSVVAKRDEMPDVEMDPAPGYNELIPHDLMHLVVEAKLGLARGINLPQVRAPFVYLCRQMNRRAM